MSEHGKSIVKNAAVVAGATLLSRVLGFVRDVIVAFALGAGLFADAFFVAFRIPNLLRRLFGEGSLTMAFIPVYSRVMEEEGEEAAQAMARSAMIWLGIILVGITLLAELLAGPLTMAIAPGFTKNIEQFNVTVDLIRICFPYVIFICGVALCMGILNARDHFLAPALAPTVLNVALIGSAFVGHFFRSECRVFNGLRCTHRRCGAVASATAVSRFRGIFMAWGLVVEESRRCTDGAAYAAHRVRCCGVSTEYPAWNIACLLSAGWICFLSVLCGPSGPVSARCIRHCVSTAALPSLARLAAKGEMEEYDKALSAALGLTLFIALPAAAGLIGLSEPVISLLFERGAFTPEAVDATARALVAYSVGLPFIALSRPLVAGFYALEDTKTPVKIAVVCLAANIGLGLWLMQSMAHVGLALAVSVSSALNFVCLHVFLARRRGTSPVSIMSTAKRCCSASASGRGYVTASWHPWWLLLIPVWVVIYVGMAFVLRMDEARMVVE